MAESVNKSNTAVVDAMSAAISSSALEVIFATSMATWTVELTEELAFYKNLFDVKVRNSMERTIMA